MKIRFDIPGEAKGKGRPRVTKTGIAYTPKETVSYENWVKCRFMESGQEKINGDVPLYANVTVYAKIPKSASKKARAAMLLDAILPMKKPDADNILKIIFDSLNGIAYDDDKQIVQIWYRKMYSENPRVDVEIAPVELPQLV